jgi:hypothetical protein
LCNDIAECCDIVDGRKLAPSRLLHRGKSQLSPPLRLSTPADRAIGDHGDDGAHTQLGQLLDDIVHRGRMLQERDSDSQVKRRLVKGSASDVNPAARRSPLDPLNGGPVGTSRAIYCDDRISHPLPHDMRKMGEFVSLHNKVIPFHMVRSDIEEI